MLHSARLIGGASMEGLCRLCNRSAILQHSHILPAFVFRWLKQDGFIRHSAQIDKRVQDGAKEYWLCSDCEGLFNGWETQFANKIFNPISYDGKLPTISYGEWLLKFCASVSWRSLLYTREQAKFTYFSERQLALVDKALDTWASFLRAELPHPAEFQQHLIPFGAIDASNVIDFPPNIHRYLLRAVEINAGSGGETAFIFSKLGRLGILGFIDLRRPEHWVGTRIKLRGGMIRPTRFVLPIQFGRYLADRAQRTWDALEQLSDFQVQKIDATVRKNIDRYANSQLFEATQKDVALFGNAAFRKPKARNP